MDTDRYGRPKPPKKTETMEILESLGFDPSEYRQWKSKWVVLRLSAPARGAVCYLTFKQYMRLVKKAGINSPSQIGKKAENFQMSRRGDTGDYEIGNCRFLTASQNLEEKKQNGGTFRGAENTARKIRGRTKETDKGYASVSEFRSKAFKLRDPGGCVHTGKNLKEFCATQSLHRGAMAAVCRGDAIHHKGWTGRYIKKGKV